MRILLCNWRDIRHPRAGGAEVLTQGFARELVKRGHQIDWYAGAFRGGPPHETIEGINVYRGGNAVTVRWHAYKFFQRASDYDFIIDEINTLPFFSPLYSKRAVAFICQLAREVWLYETPQPVASFGYGIEPLYLRPYHHAPTLSISQSTTQSLRDIGFKGAIGVMPMAIDQYDAGPPLDFADREDTLVALCRVTPSKRIDHMILALSLLPPEYFRLKLQIIGKGPLKELTRLRALAEAHGVAERVQWLGYIDESHKRAILRRAKCLLMTSVREGWGLAVTEANLCGTPAITYDVPGLRDSVRNGETGLLTACHPHALAAGIIRLLEDRKTYETFATESQRVAQTLTWEGTADFVEDFLATLSKRT